MSIFSAERFIRFCSVLKVDTKELGRAPLKLLGTQRYMIQEIEDGLRKGVHTFVILKGRQLGISTVMLALDLYWMFKHPGLQGAVVTDTDENRELFRSLVEQYIDSLPPALRPPIAKHNRVQLIVGHPKAQSRMLYMVAGTKKNGELGRAKAVNFMHATECSSWGDEEGFASLQNTLAQQNPDRLYVYESTARGFDIFYETWRVAKASKTQRAIFIGWWRNELYTKPEGSVEYNTYWDGDLTSDERLWVREVWEQYHFNIKPEQIAWWRWYVAEQMKGDENLALQEMPPTEDYAFQLSGSKFFSAERVNQQFQLALRKEPTYYRYRFGLHFEDTEFFETNADNAEVTVWEHPLPNREKGVYAFGADPAYGSSEWADEFAGQMLRCYADRIEQVLELGGTDFTEQQYAWVIAHLCGWYGNNVMLNLEMQGPGGAVYNELLNLREKAGMMPKGTADEVVSGYNVVARVRDYMWKKQDSLAGNFALQWQTNHKEKIRMMSTLRSYWERDMVIVNSPDCLQQFRNIHRNGDQIGGEGRAKDDRVIALAIGVIAWNDWMMREMMAMNRTYARENRPEEPAREVTVVERSIVNYLNEAGVLLRGVNDGRTRSQ